MRNRFKRFMIVLLLAISPALSSNVPSARADFFGGDLPLLMEIVSTTLEQLTQLRQILGNGQDTLGLLRDINQGIREAMGIIRTMNQTIHPGVLSDIHSVDEMLRVLRDLYGAIPKSPEARLQGFTDQSVAEAISLHNQAFAYADEVDPEAERIKDYSRDVSPVGAGRLTAQSLGVLIHVTNQLLRTNAAMLKVMSQNLALQNRREKVNSEQFRMQYEGLSSGLRSSSSFQDLTTLRQ